MVFDISVCSTTAGLIDRQHRRPMPASEERAMKYYLTMMAICLMLNNYGCVQPAEEDTSGSVSVFDLSNPPKKAHNTKSTTTKSKPDHGGVGARFKVPVPKGEKWEITQSWAEHCEECDLAYPSNYSYCDSSHAGAGCDYYCNYSWDFNLKDDGDKGKPVLAAGGGKIKTATYKANSWGNTVVIDHGDNICTRYAHMEDDSITVSEGQQVCQGLKLGTIGNTGYAEGNHLHFQFEECDTGTPLKMGFDDGNDVPKCKMGNDVNDAYGNYTALILSNSQVDKCEEGPSEFGDAELSDKGWTSSSCGTLSGCPMIPNCGNQYGHQFKDQSQLSGEVAQAAAYLHSECVLDGKTDGKLHPQDDITRAEALKVSLQLFGLGSNCGSSVPFQDVQKKDWFYDTVACGVKHGIISSDKKNFNPNMPVSMGEGAKMLVKSASKSGVISLENGKGYFSKVSPSHWAYKYLRTLNHYGGLEGGMLSKSAEDQITRGQFIVMTASLSPCYCKNISCTGNCVCDQSVYACIDPQDTSPGTGGAGSNKEEAEEETEPQTQPKPSINNSSVEASINCFVQPEDCRCENGKTVIYIRCELSNKSNKELKVDDLLMSLSSSGSDCQVTDPQLDKGVGYQKLDAGVTKKMNGHFEISCSKMPQGSGLQTSIDMVEKLDIGDLKTHKNLFNSKITVPQEPFNKCSPTSTPTPAQTSGNSAQPSGTPPQETSWKCDPAKGYTIHVWSPWGIYEAVGSGPIPYITNKMEPGLAYPILYDCIDLPGAVRIHGGPQGMKIWQPDPGMPGFNVWFPFNLPTTINPPYKPDVSTGSFNSSQPYTSALFRFPPQ